MNAFLGVFLAPLRDPIRALSSSLLGAGLAWAWFRDRATLAIIVAAAALGIGLLIQWLGPRQLPMKPKRAMKLMNGTILVYAVMYAIAAAAVIVITVEVAAETSDPADTTKLIAAVSSALTTFVAALLVAGDKTDATLGGYIRREFFAAYGTIAETETVKKDDQPAVKPVARWEKVGKLVLFPAESDAQYYLYTTGAQDLDDWSHDTRVKRAKKLQEYLDAPP